LIKKDLDLLKQIDANAILPEDLKQNPGRGVIVSFSFSTLDEQLARQLEPGAPSPQKRMETLKLFSDNGFLCGVNAMPLLPYISDKIIILICSKNMRRCTDQFITRHGSINKN
jgi:DNA repair photolyase